MLTISLVGQKGGTGKSTIAEVLAVAFSLDAKTKSVVILDLDPQTTATNWYDRREDKERITAISCQPSRLKKTWYSADELGADVVIIDTPAKNAEASIEAARLADLCLIPSQPQINDIETLTSTDGIIRVSGCVKNFCVVNRAPTQGARHKEAAREISKTTGLTVAPVYLFNRAAYGYAQILGQSPQEYDPNSKAAWECAQLHRWVCEIVKS